MLPFINHKRKRIWEMKGSSQAEDPAARLNGRVRMSHKSNTCPSDPENLVTPPDQSPRFRKATLTLAPRKWDFGSHICTNSSPHSCSRPEREITVTEITCLKSTHPHNNCPQDSSRKFCPRATLFNQHSIFSGASAQSA